MTVIMRIRHFWEWFEQHADILAATTIPRDEIGDLDEKIACIHPDLQWEIGPISDQEHYIAISPGSESNLYMIAEQAVSMAPYIKDWHYQIYRPAKPNCMILRYGDALIDASRWRFVALKYKDGFFEILLWTGKANIPEGNIGALDMLICNILGEKFVREHVDSISLAGESDQMLEDESRLLSEMRALLCEPARA